MSNFDNNRRLRILVVDDEWLVREALVDVLDEAGFSTRQAMSAAEALRQLQRDEAVDVVVTDIEMPGMLNGVDLARVLAAQRPEIGVLIVSGRRPRALPEGARFLAKPFVPEELLHALNDLAASVSVH
ncbi:MAG: response regulator [Methylovirgula sp.]|uniref:response regulator n=1 Tax=Methylovirgula sp. TaxID=1978224 RepID=UPI00307655F1